MNYLYHMYPKEMKSQTLYPLNQLKNTYSKIYKEQKEKYKGRMQIMKRRIPELNCKWNDVIHLSPVNPNKINSILKNMGFRGFSGNKCIRINPKILDKDKIIVYPYKERFMKDSKFIKFDQKKLSSYDKIGKKTIDYYKEVFKRRQKPLLYVCIPHILYKGTININKCKITNIK